MASSASAIIFFACANIVLTFAAPAVPVFPRFEINDVMALPKFAEQRDLLVLSLREAMDMNPNDPFSFYQIAGIHGMPALPWNNITNKTTPYNNATAANRWMGYCEHGSNLFPAWHRPYVLLLETSIRGLAKKIASRYPRHLKKAYLSAADKLRWPYWDWARSSNRIVPGFLMSSKLTVTGSSGKLVSVVNPFASYKFQKHTAPDVLMTDAPPAYSSWPYTVKKDYVTVRWPVVPSNVSSYKISEGPYVTNDTAFKTTLIFNKPYGVSFAQSVRDLMSTKEWECFATPSASPNCTFLSIEGIHNLIHLYTGGHLPKPNNTITGFMSVLETAAFDPIFYLHHANVDRLIALWQVINPKTWVTPGTSGGTYMYDRGQPIDASSPLYPFPLSSTSVNGHGDRLIMTAKDARDFQALGYTYDDLILTHNPQQLYKRMDKLYGSPDENAFRWYMYANCSTTNPNITMSWQISIDPTFNRSAAVTDRILGRKLLQGGDSSGSPMGSTRANSNATGQRLHERKALQDEDAAMEPVTSSEEISLGRTVMPSLMQYNMMKPKSAPDPLLLKATVTTTSSATSVDITRFLRFHGVTGLNPAPLDPDDLSKGPSSFPLKPVQIGARCQEYYSGAPLQCQCQTQISWVIAEPGAFLNYKGPVL